MAKKRNRKLPVEEIWVLYNRAEEYSLYVDEQGDDSKNLEAFLMLASLFEAVLVSLAITLLDTKNNLSALRGKRDKRYGIDKAINDLYLLGAVDTKEFGLLEQFKDGRNKFFHDLFSLNAEEVETKSHELFEEHKDFFKKMVKRLEDELGK